MAVLPSHRGRSLREHHIYTFSKSRTPTDRLSPIDRALSRPPDQQVLQVLAALLKTKEFIGQTSAMKPHDFDLSDGAHEVMYVTCRMGARQELVFKIGPGTLMRHAIDRCLETWRHPEGRRYMAWELFFYLPCNTRIDYYKPMTVKELGVENHDLIDVFSESHGG